MKTNNKTVYLVVTIDKPYMIVNVSNDIEGLKKQYSKKNYNFFVVQ
jgi:hypothetical protein